MHGVLDELHPGVALVLGAGQNLHHLGLLDARRDQEETSLLVGHLAHDQLLERDDGGALILEREGRRKGRRGYGGRRGGERGGAGKEGGDGGRQWEGVRLA